MAYRGPALQHKIRQLTFGNETGDSFGITIPRIIAEHFSGCFLRISVSGNMIVMESGCKLKAEDIKEITIQGEYTAMRKVYKVGGPPEIFK